MITWDERRHALDVGTQSTGELVPVFMNVNEEEEVYGEHGNLEDAMRNLREFPNDSIRITLHRR